MNERRRVNKGKVGVPVHGGFVVHVTICYRKAHIFRFLNDSMLEAKAEASECI